MALPAPLFINSENLPPSESPANPDFLACLYISFSSFQASLDQENGSPSGPAAAFACSAHFLNLLGGDKRIFEGR
jgi:hypothetical protein